MSLVEQIFLSVQFEGHPDRTLSDLVGQERLDLLTPAK